MKHFAAIAMVAAALCATASAQIRRPSSSASSEDGIYSRTIIHPDETRTVSKQDTNNKIREKRTLDKNGILLMKSLFQLNAAGKAINGLVYDGRNRLLYRSEFTYDGANRLEEERVYDAGGTLVRRLFYKADKLGRRKPVSQTIFKNGGQSSSRSSGSFEHLSTTDSHAYRNGGGGGGVANTPSAYKRTAKPAPRAKPAASRSTTRSARSSRKEKSKRRFRIFGGRK